MNKTSEIKKQVISPWIKESIYGISLLIIGGVVGAVIQNAISNGLSGLDFTILVLISAEVVILIYIREHLDKENKFSLSVHDALHNIENRLGLEVIYQETSTLNKLGKDAVDYVSKVMETAQEEILILDTNDTKVKRDDYYLDQDLRSKYFDLLLEKVERQSAKGIPFTYKRICQFIQSSSTFREIEDPIFLEHCRKMINLGQTSGYRVYLKKAVVSYPMTFKMVDRKYLILHINGMKHEGKRFLPYLKGEIIIHDPQQELISVFLRAWDQVENATETTSASARDLSEGKRTQK